MEEDGQTFSAEGVIADKQVATGNTGGKNWERLTIKLEGDPNTYSCFGNEGQKHLFKFQLGDSVKLIGKVNGKYMNLLEGKFNREATVQGKLNLTEEIVEDVQGKATPALQATHNGSLTIMFLKCETGEGLMLLLNEFKEKHKVKATQTGWNHTTQTYYAFVFYE